MNSVERQATIRSRRAFLTMGAGAVAAYGGWTWLRSRPQEGGVPWPIRNVLRVNEKVAGAYLSDGHLAPTFNEEQVNSELRVNGDVGMGDDFDPKAWHLNVQIPQAEPLQITLDQIRALPKFEQTTQLNCIEGWTAIAHWGGARFSDFTAKFAPSESNATYVSMQTPDKKYFVGLDAASALHPQTLLCYELNGEMLPYEHGAPLRLVIPVKYGVKKIKRIGTIKYLQDRPEDYWANEGYDWFAGL
ncbi:MAG: molybdopterin-dependent oxidoreductase [Bryobacteraceae bacterium]